VGNPHDTQIGGFQGRFSTTRWTVIVNSQNSDEDCKRMILDELFQKYWKPVYWYIRRKGYDNEKAKDLTQGFFTEIVWGRDLIQSANPQKGRFRSFLLTALDRYLTDTWRYEHSQKRMPSKEIFSCDVDDACELADIEKAGELNAQEAFNSVWLLELLQQSLAEVQKDMEEDGMGKYWVLFERHCLEPILKTSKPPVLKETCKTLNIDDPAKASNMIVTVKRRVKKTIIQNLQKIEGEKSNLEEEISALTGKILI
jgi:DNA-directed RNA polymerase specialized sigma24 family protein